jgi:hypothetical protein
MRTGQRKVTVYLAYLMNPYPWVTSNVYRALLLPGAYHLWQALNWRR